MTRTNCDVIFARNGIKCDDAASRTIRVDAFHTREDHRRRSDTAGTNRQREDCPPTRSFTNHSFARRRAAGCRTVIRPDRTVRGDRDDIVLKQSRSDTNAERNRRRYVGGRCVVCRRCVGPHQRRSCGDRPPTLPRTDSNDILIRDRIEGHGASAHTVRGDVVGACD